jgi:sterol desaturase/sphingolipid hydroxylase (fatty acid hydroxylase superfamily)
MVCVGLPLCVSLFGKKREQETAVVWANALAATVDLVATILFFFVLGVIGSLFAPSERGVYAEGLFVFKATLTWVKTALVDRVPTVAVLPTPIAIVVWYLATGFVDYVLHRAWHTSRVLWFLVHRPHHIPTVLAGFVPPTAALSVLFKGAPAAVLLAVILKLFSASPSPTILFVVVTGWGISASMSHQTALYPYLMKRPFRYFFGLFAGGPYHYAHHSALPGDEMVNMDGWGPFMLWDRVFGTYRAPTEVPPPVGLTRDPEIRLSPFLILYSGYQQLAYELWMNQGLVTRLKILFGGVGYKPPITRDFLIIGPRETASVPRVATTEATSQAAAE